MCRTRTPTSNKFQGLTAVLFFPTVSGQWRDTDTDLQEADRDQLSGTGLCGGEEGLSRGGSWAGMQSQPGPHRSPKQPRGPPGVSPSEESGLGLAPPQGPVRGCGLSLGGETGLWTAVVRNPGGESGKLTEPRGTWSSVCTHRRGWRDEEQAHVFLSILQKEKQFPLECPGSRPATEAWNWMPNS